MNRLSKYSLLCAFALLSASAASAQRSKMTHLERANATFRAADPDSNGRLVAAELSRASISARTVQAWDADANGELSRDEFLLYYRQLLTNSGQVPGGDFDLEAKRIEKLRREAKDSRGQAARKKAAGESGQGVVEKPAPKPEISTVEKYRRAQAALNERMKKVGGPSPVAGQAQQGSSQRARGVGVTTSAGQSSGAGGASSDIRARLQRAQSVLQGRAQAGGMTREQYEMVNSGLQRRAAASRQVPVKQELPTVAEKYGKAKDNVTSKAVASGARRPRVQHTQDSLTRRARQAVGSGLEAGFSAEELAGLPEPERKKLQASLEKLRIRARGAGWTAEQFESEKRRLLKRAKEAHGDRQEASSGDQQRIQDAREQGSKGKAKQDGESARQEPSKKPVVKPTKQSAKKPAEEEATDAKANDRKVGDRAGDR